MVCENISCLESGIFILMLFQIDEFDVCGCILFVFYFVLFCGFQFGKECVGCGVLCELCEEYVCYLWQCVGVELCVIDDEGYCVVGYQVQCFVE